MSDGVLERSEAESFLYEEAAMIDEWRLSEWAALFTESGRYFVHPATIAEDARAEDALFYIADDCNLIRERAIRLGKATAFSEYPRSYVRHFISNVRVQQAQAGTARVRCNFMVHRWRERVDLYVGNAIYDLDLSRDTPRIITKRCVLAAGDLRMQERISIIL